VSVGLGGAGVRFKLTPFDEMYGEESSRTPVHNKLMETRERQGKEWLFNPDAAGKLQVFDGRTGKTDR